MSGMLVDLMRTTAVLLHQHIRKIEAPQRSPQASAALLMLRKVQLAISQ